MPSSIRSWSTYFYDLSCKTSTSKIVKVGREPWSRGYGRRLMFRRLWVRIPSMYNGCAWFEKTKINENEAGDKPIWKKRFWRHQLLSQMFFVFFKCANPGLFFKCFVNAFLKWDKMAHLAFMMFLNGKQSVWLDAAKFRHFGKVLLDFGNW